VYNPSFQLRGFDTLPLEARCPLVLVLTRALVDVDLQYLKYNPRTPLLYQSGVIYRFQCHPDVANSNSPCPPDIWEDIPRALEVGGASCNGLAAWRVAELIASGADPRAGIYIRSKQAPGFGTIYHVVVKRNGGQFFEDPARQLGMPG
jgi:hypothetical protein